MNRFAKELLVLAVVVLLVALLAPESISANSRIEHPHTFEPSFDNPAYSNSLPATLRVHGVSLGCRRGEVEDVLGPADDEQSQGVVQYKRNSGYLWLRFDRDGWVDWICSNRPRTRLEIGAQSFQVGSTRISSLLMALGDPSRERPNTQRWKGEGWTLETNDYDGVLGYISVEKPRLVVRTYP